MYICILSGRVGDIYESVKYAPLASDARMCCGERGCLQRSESWVPITSMHTECLANNRIFHVRIVCGAVFDNDSHDPPLTVVIYYNPKNINIPSSAERDSIEWANAEWENTSVSCRNSSTHRFTGTRFGAMIDKWSGHSINWALEIQHLRQ